ncbi:polyketide cyclase [Solimonas sp. K1W22B-7]|uniref:SRPBCC family protein n=1 Tax=Solimonas sp. K1W22B-7 TaxID=2303331 RepID=UPI000E330211|nr:SRPBCC family protein [Solimonas sp. K1W22B-7]AXQ27982.1 polyketide cyclase [Solimonas sp. K1W22B-7]
MPSFSAIVETRIAAPRAAVFEAIVPIDLPSIFTGYGPLPAVTGTREQSGAWDGAGQTRVVMLSDGSEAGERMDRYRHPEYFAYTVSGFTGVLRWLVHSANGEWWFEPEGEGTRVRWRYAFNARSWVVALPVWFITRMLWRGYMGKALRLSREGIEA